MGELIVRRARGWFGLLRNYRLLVDGEERARIGSGRSVRLQVPDGPVTVQARVDRRGSLPWHGVVGDESTKLLVRNLDSVGAMVRPDDQLEIVPDTDPATPSPHVDVVKRRRHFFWWYGALLVSGIAYLTLLFLFIHHPWVLVVGSVLWVGVLVAAIVQLVRSLRAILHRSDGMSETTSGQSTGAARGLVVLIPLPLIWVIDTVLMQVLHWPLVVVLPVFVVLWTVLGLLALRLYDSRREART